MRSCHRSGSLGEFNALPLPTTFLSAGLWTGYAFMCSNPWLHPSNALGTAAALYMSVLAYGVAGPKVCFAIP